MSGGEWAGIAIAGIISFGGIVIAAILKFGPNVTDDNECTTKAEVAGMKARIDNLEQHLPAVQAGLIDLRREFGGDLQRLKDDILRETKAHVGRVMHHKGEE